MFKNQSEAAGYLAGLVDGEGHIGRTPTKRKDGTYSGRNRSVVVTNTDERIIAAAAAACDRLGLTYHVYTRTDRARRSNVFGKKPLHDLVITRRANLTRFGSLVTLHSEKAERFAELLSSYPRWYGPMPEREELDRICRTDGQRGAAKHYGVSQGTIFNWRRRHAL